MAEERLSAKLTRLRSLTDRINQIQWTLKRSVEEALELQNLAEQRRTLQAELRPTLVRT